MSFPDMARRDRGPRGERDVAIVPPTTTTSAMGELIVVSDNPDVGVGTTVECGAHPRWATWLLGHYGSLDRTTRVVRTPTCPLDAATFPSYPPTTVLDEAA